MSADFTIRDLTADDLDGAFDVRSRSFGLLSAEHRGWWNDIQQESINARRTIGVFDGNRLLAHAKVRSYQQFWGGRPMAMGGVAGVVVAPDARGRGVGTRLMTALAQRSLELGDLVSALYPATIPIYRGLGWEIAGAQYKISIPAEALRTLGGREVPLRTATTSDVGPFLASLHDRYVAQRANGPKLPTEDEAREQLTDDGMMSYFVEGGAVGIGGHVAYEWAGEDLVVSYLSADTPEVARALWSVVGSGSSTVRKVEAYLAPQDAIHFLLSQEVAHETYLKRWMLRVLDAPKAIAARGFSPSVSGSAVIALHDPLLPGNTGSWQMEMSGGRAELIPIVDTDVSPVSSAQPSAWPQRVCGHVCRSSNPPAAYCRSGLRWRPGQRRPARCGVRRLAGIPARVFLDRLHLDRPRCPHSPEARGQALLAS